MTEVGIRELRDRLSGYLARVRDGEELVVTDHGTAIARIVPLSGQRAIDALIAEGVVERARQPRRSRPSRRVKVTGDVSDLVADQRR